MRAPRYLRAGDSFAHRGGIAVEFAAPQRRISACLHVHKELTAPHEGGIILRLAGDTIELTPPLIVSEAQIDEIMGKTAASIKAAA